MSANYPTQYFIRDICINPAVVLAPMEGVTNIMFRRFIRKIGGTGLTYTEFIPSKALSGKGSKVLKMTEFDPDETPIAIQIFGKDPKYMATAAKVVQDLGASILDINMGCPSKQVCANSGGSALMKEPDLAIEIVKAVRKAVDIPLTVKMRSGFDHDCKNAPDLAYACQEEGAEGITVHWRTRTDNYGGIQEWETIRKVKEKLRIPVIGNGDIIDVQSAKKMFDETKCDAVMIGRGAMKNPWCILEIAQFLKGLPYTPPNANDKKEMLLDLLNTYSSQISYEPSSLGKFKQIAKYFIGELSNAEDFRKTLLRAQTIQEASLMIHDFFEQ